MGKSYSEGFDSTYCYPNTNILINKLNIKNQDELHLAEAEITTQRINQIKNDNLIPGKFDTNHLKAIHHHIFQDIYPWAGEIRTVDIAKSNMFCRVMFIEDQLSDIFNRLHRENCLKNITDINIMSERLSYYLSEINAVHPFREGNGRTQRLFIEQLAEQAGYQIHFSKISKQDMITASIQSFECNYELMNKLMRQCISHKTTIPEETARIDQIKPEKSVSKMTRGEQAEELFGSIIAKQRDTNDFSLR